MELQLEMQLRRVSRSVGLGSVWDGDMDKHHRPLSLGIP